MKKKSNNDIIWQTTFTEGKGDILSLQVTKYN